jgi:hypothetical protein
MIVTYQHPGTNGGTWYAADYPSLYGEGSGATRYYATAEARRTATLRFSDALESAGIPCGILETENA